MWCLCNRSGWRLHISYQASNFLARHHARRCLPPVEAGFDKGQPARPGIMPCPLHAVEDSLASVHVSRPHKDADDRTVALWNRLQAWTEQLTSDIKSAW